ncbi:MAG: hypothetical protein EBZ44_01335 [Verrucomicrobia bacterium]|nr:hypothetical protein [bacterium]NDA09490.1 hypothetical protein [Verrucomicrobiota bacterium]NDA25622.1 hypothetical protein [Verrucomicrobiota bacterium]NDD56358.1 hypothetical protein [Verrucomicrobiota bacterium]NDD81403.1 hypothetical protein [Verrucomicrobiota bacterium]
MRAPVLLGLMILLAGSLRGEDIVLISGGPALRAHERFKTASHDKYWGNFIDSALARVQELRKELPKDRVTWLVFRPGYATRGEDDKQDYFKIIEERGQKHGLVPVYFDNKDQLFKLLRRDGSPERPKIARLEYYGHSNKKCWMFDYSNRVDGGALEPLVVHVDDLENISGSSFTPNATCVSYGCHSGEEFSQRWRMIVGRPMVGAIGKTDYSDGGMPKLSDGKGGSWAY